MIIINPNKRKPSLQSIRKELAKSYYGDLILDVNISKRFLRHSIRTSKVGSNEFYRYVNYLSDTPAHLIVFYRKYGLFIFRFEKEILEISEYSFLFLMGWFNKVINGFETEDEIEIIHKSIYKNIIK
jgi:hypothetical protein